MSMHIDTARAWLLYADELPDTERTVDAIRTVLERLAELEAQRAAVLALADEQERRAHELVGLFSGHRGAPVPAWVGRVRAALGVGA